MGAKRVNEGGHVSHTPGGAVDAGDVVVVGSLLGVAERAIASGEVGAIAVEGVFDFPKTAGASTAIAAGAKAYWKADDEVADDDPTVGKFLGMTVAAALDDDTTVRVRLGQDGAGTKAAVVAALGSTTNLTAIGGVFGDLAAARTAVNTLATETEARLDAVEAKADAIIASLKAAGLMASS